MKELTPEQTKAAQAKTFTLDDMINCFNEARESRWHSGSKWQSFSHYYESQFIVKVSELFSYPEEPMKLISLPENQEAAKEIEEKAHSKHEAVEMLMDAGILEYKHYYCLGDWFWNQSRGDIMETLEKRKKILESRSELFL